MTEQQPSQDLTIAQINEVARSTGLDCFQLRIARRQTGAYPQTIAIFDNALAEHIATPEPWLGRLAGGGTFYLTVTHVQDKTKQIGGPLNVYANGQPRPVNMDLPTKPDWNGPRDLSFPTREDLPSDVNARLTSFDVGGGGAGGGASQRGLGQGPTTPDVFISSTPSGASSALDVERVRLEAKSQELDRRIRTADEERHKVEVESMRLRQELEIQKLRSEMQTANAVSKQPADTGFTQLILEMKKSSDESTRMFLTMVKESSAEMRMMMAEMQKQSMSMFEKLSAKPAMDPLLERIIVSKENQAEVQMKMMSGYAEAVGAAVNMAVGALHNVSEIMQPPDQEPMWLKAMRELMKGVSAMRVMPKAPTVRAPRPTRVAPPMPPPPQIQAPMTVPLASDVPPPRVNGASKAFDGLPMDQAQPAQGDATRALTPYEQIIRAITEQRDEKEIAKFFIDNLDEQSIAEALAAAGQNILVAFAAPLEEWLKSVDNQKWIAEKLLPAVQAYADKAMPGRIALQGGPQGEEEEEEDGEEDAEIEPTAQA